MAKWGFPMPKIRRALISVTDKSGVPEFAKALGDVKTLAKVKAGTAVRVSVFA